MTDRSTAGPPQKIGALAAAMWLLLAGMTTPVAASGAGNQVATAGNIVYQTDSGLEVTDATAGNLPSGNPFTDRYTLALSGLTLSAAGNAQAAVTVDRRTDTETELSGIDTSRTDVTVDPDGIQRVTIAGGFQTLTYVTPSFEVAGSDTDVNYQADSEASLTYPNSGLADGTTVEAIDTSDGTVLDTADADTSGLLGFSALPAGTYTVNASEIDTEPPSAVTGADLTVDEDTSVAFDATGSTDDGQIASYEWDFDDGTTATGATPSHTFADPGTYAVQLTVTDTAGETDSDTRTITVGDTTAPTADAGSDRTVDEDTAVTFDASASTDNGNIASYEWDWTSDGTYAGSGVGPTHSFTDPGTYTVTLRVTDDAGQTDADTVTITVGDVTPPTAEAGSDRTVDEDTAVTLDGTGSTDNDNIASYEWDVDDDGTYENTGTPVSHTYADPGTYTATLLVTDTDDNTDTDTVTITVTDTTTPTADAGSGRTVDEDTAVTFDASASTDNGNIASYEWDWTNDGTYEGSGQTATHIYTDPGTYAVPLRVTDGDGNTDTDSVTLTVEDVTPPVADAGSNQTVDEDTVMILNGTDSTDNVGIASYEWDWTSDGSYEATGETASHTYADPGTYTATLRVTDSGGNTDTAQRTVNVEHVGGGGGGGYYDDTDPTARTQPNVTIDAGTTLPFDGSNSTDNDEVWTYEWDFDGDGDYENSGVTVSRNYTTLGVYTVTLRVTDDYDNTDTAERVVTVTDATPPTAVTQPNVTVDAGTGVVFNASNSTDNENITSYEWDFTGDGTYDASGLTDNYTYSDPGTYNATLRVTDRGNNTDTAHRMVTVQAVNESEENTSSGTGGGEDGDGVGEEDTESGAGDPGNDGAATATSPATAAPTETNTDSADMAGSVTTSPETTTGGSGPLSPVLAVIAIMLSVLVHRSCRRR